MHMNPKRPAAAFLSAVMLLGMFSPPAQALNTGGTADPAATQSLGDHPIQTLPELDHDASPEAGTTPDRIDWLPLVPATSIAPAETIPALKLTPAQKAEQNEAPAEPEDQELPEIQLFARDEVYTSATASNHVHSGDGTYANPYNLFDDAVKNAMPGGTIIIKNKGFLNTLNETGSLPYIIDKELTIKSEDPNSPASLQVRAGGIVLGADLTIENVNLNFENRVHDAFFANGHTLTLKNVLRANGSREVDLFGGQLYEKSTNRAYAVDKKGSNSQIIIEMDDPKLAQYSSIHFGNIYAGSMNGSFDGSTNVQIKSSTYKGNSFIGAVYASGADETPAGNMLDIVEPDPPKANSKYTTSGNVTFDFDNLPLRFVESDSKKVMLIDGNTGSSSKTSLTVSVPSPTNNIKLNDISSLTIKGNALQPTGQSTTNFDNITINQNAELDLSKMPSPVTTKALSGQGKLTLKKDGLLNVSQRFSDTLAFQTEGGWNNESGLVHEHTYITVPVDSNGSFTFTPHLAQKNWKFEKETTNWRIIKPTGTQDLPTLTSLTIDPNNAYQTIYTLPPNGDTSIAKFRFQVTFESPDDNGYEILESFDVTVKEQSSNTPIQMIYDSNNDFYHADEIPFDISFEDEGNDITLRIEKSLDSNINSKQVKPIPIGTYEIEFGYPRIDGTMLKAKVYLNSIPNPPEPEPQASNSQITVTTSPSPTTFGQSITVTANIQSATTFSSRAAETIEKNKAYLYINGKQLKNIVDTTNGTITFNNIAVTKENHFQAGENQISVVYGGGNLTDLGALKSSIGTATITVNKTSATINGVNKDSPIHTVYNGSHVSYSNDNITVTVANQPITSPKISVIYEQGGQPLSQSPVLPGTYTTKVQIAEGDTYTEKTVDGPQIIIDKATPKLSLSHSFSKDGKVILQAYLQGVDNGIPPTGEVTFTTGTTTQKAPVNYNIATTEFSNLPTGANKITAIYNPTTGSSGSAEIYNSSSSVETTITLENNHKPLTGITFDQNTLVLKKDTTATLNANFQPADATNKNLIWSSSNENVATVSNNTVSAKKAGTTTIEARSVEGGYIATCQVTVTDQDIAVTGVTINVPNTTLAIGQSDQLSAIITPHNATSRKVTWSSDSDNVSIDAETGKVTAQKAGSATITAEVGGQKNTCVITVKQDIPVDAIKLNAESLSLKENETIQLKANITPDNATNQKVTWESSAPESVQIDEETGWVTAKKITSQPVTITATTENGQKKADCKITVTAGGQTVNVQSVTLSSQFLELDVNQTHNLTFEVLPLQATNKKVNWASSSSDVTVDQNGLVKAIKAGGSAVITVTTEDQKKTATCTVKVKGETPTPVPPTITISPSTLSITEGNTGTLSAEVKNGSSNPNITWSIIKGSEFITLQSPSTGKSVTIQGKKEGSATVQATYTDGTSRSPITATATVEVTEAPTPPTPSAPKIEISPDHLDLTVGGAAQQLTATVTDDSNPSKTVQWTVEGDSDVVSLSTPNALSTNVVPQKAGSVTVKATYMPQSGQPISSTAVVNVQDGTIPPPAAAPTIAISPNPLNLEVKGTGTLTATVENKDGGTVTWTLETQNGVIQLNDPLNESSVHVSALTSGTATVKATYTRADGKTANATATVNVSNTPKPEKPPVSSVQINGGDISLKTGASHTFTANVLPAGAEQTVTWSASPEGILSVDASTGKVTARKAGRATLTATSTADTQKSNSITVTVADVPVTEVKIIEAPLSLREGRGAQLVVRVSPSDATDPSVKWESDDTDVLRVDRDGYVTAERRGSATITVTSVAHPELKDSRTISVTRSSSGGSSGGSSHRPSNPSKPDNKPKPETTKPEPPKPTVPTPQIPQTVNPEPPKPGTPVITSAPPVNPTLNTTFTDIPTTHWASEPIKDVVSRGLFVGTEKGNFSPDESMTRAMVVTVLHRLAGEPIVQSSNQFIDVGRAYYTDAVTWANQNHIVSGTSANTFAPNLMVTREELVVMLYRVANPAAGSSADLTRFADSGKVSSWASTPMQWAVQTGILKGSDGALLPQNKLSRAEAASLISRFTEQFLTR